MISLRQKKKKIKIVDNVEWFELNWMKSMNVNLPKRPKQYCFKDME